MQFKLIFCLRQERHRNSLLTKERWIPAFAGMTVTEMLSGRIFLIIISNQSV